MILSDREIRAAIDRGHIVIRPVPDLKHWTSTAIDLTLDTNIRKWRCLKNLPTGQPGSVRPHAAGFDIKELIYSNDYTEGLSIGSQGLDLPPKSFVLGFTEQSVYLPLYTRLAARVEGKSSLARLGVGVHVTAPTIHAGFGRVGSEDENQEQGSPIQLEIFNLSELTVTLDKGMPICQLILEEVRETPDKGYIGKFSDQPKFQS
jgi:dCTP deaminase